jgi:alpha-glucosidase
MTSLPYAAPGAVHDYTHNERSLILDGSSTHLILSVLSPGIVRVRLARAGVVSPQPSWAVVPPDDAFPVVGFQVHEAEQAIRLETERLSVHIARDTGHISCIDQAGRVFCADEAGIHVGTEEDRGSLFAESDVASQRSGRVTCAKRMEPGTNFVGFGERTGPLNRRGWQMVNWATDPATSHGHGPNTDPLYLAIPVMMVASTELTYGVFFNNTHYSRFSIGHDTPGVWMMEALGGELDYYIIYGPHPSQVSEGLAALLGTMPLPPRWALGYHQSRWGYDREEVVREVVNTFRQRDIPCDVMHLDIDYMHGYRVFTWDNERFPQPQKLLADLSDAGFRTVTIIDPGVKIDPNYEVYQDGLKRDMFVREADGEVFTGYAWPDAVVFPDFTRPNVRQWWGDYVGRMVAQGVSGIWNDMNEPAVFDRPFSEGAVQVGTIPLDAVQGPEDERTTHAELHNLYGHTMAQATYEGLRRHHPDERPFVLTRSGFAGIQRWSACWMGDNSSWWEHLEMSMPQMINMGLSGAPFVGTDIGGFFAHGDAELLARWIQFGSLFPFCRGHSCTGTLPQEPWAFGEQVEAIYRDYLRLRYRLLPYLYTLFWEASQHGTPIMRPLFYHFPDDQKSHAIHDQVLLGPSLMAAPIYRPGHMYRAVYIPPGEWFDWWTDERLVGPTHVLAHAPLEHMPLYVRAGSILPMGPDIQYTDEKPLSPLTLHLYPGSGVCTLYEDDGRTFAYEQEQWRTTRYELTMEAGALVLTIEAGGGHYAPPPRQLVIQLHAVEACAANDHPDAVYDAEQRRLTLTMQDDVPQLRLRFQLC